MKKFAWYGSSVALAALLAVTLLVTGGSSAFAAAPTASFASPSATAGAANILSVVSSDADAATDFAVFSISTSSTGTAHFTQGGGQSVIIFDGGTGDVDGAQDGTIQASVVADTAGAIIVNVTHTDGTDTTSVNAAYNATAAAASLSVTAAAPTVGATAGTDAVTVKVTDANGAGVVGKSISLLTNLGKFDGTVTTGTATSCAANTQACTGTTGAGGLFVVGFQGAGNTGNATLTAVSAGLTQATVNITIVGAAADATVTAKPGLVVGLNSSTELTFTVVDSAGNSVGSGQKLTGTLAVTPPTGGSGVTVSAADNAGHSLGATAGCNGTGTTAAGKCNMTVTVAANATPGVHTISQTIGTKKVTAEVTVVAKSAPATITTDAPSSMAAGSTTSIQITVLNADGNAVPDGTTVTVAATGNVVVLKNAPTTVNGVATTTLVAASGTGNAVIAFTAGTITATETVAVGAPGEQPGDGSFTGDIADSGVSIVSFDGGTVADLADAASDAGLVSVWVTVDGDFVGYIVGAPAFVNAAFNAQFADGIDAGTLAIVVK